MSDPVRVRLISMNPYVPYSSQALLHSLPPNSKPNLFSNPILSNSVSQDLSVKDLSSSLSSLKNLIHVADHTLQFLSDISLIQNSCDVKDSDYIQCAFDRRHRVPPHSLFRHSLFCSSAPQPHIDPTNLVESLLYPKTLESYRNSLNENGFHQTLPDSDSDLCFSLNDYADGNSNFFYSECPGVFSLSNQDEMSKVFTLPRILAVECANFVIKDDKQRKSLRREFRILPSDSWFLKSEVDAWNGYPCMYSHTVLCAILGSKMVTKSRLTTWIIANSPQYGVVIDAAMGNHIFLLFSLCFMAMSKEALGFLNASESGDVRECDAQKAPGNQSFKCPILIQGLTWLTSQLSILYRETNGKFFAINMLRQCILDAASDLLLLPSTHKRTESQKGFNNLDSSSSNAENFKQRNLGESIRNNDIITGEETLTGREIFVSQVAAAVAALHERFLLEEKIKGLRFSHLRTNYQLISEHNYILQKADEERRKRSDYRPIIEHDGLPKQPSHDEDSSKTKTREELLAEQRDYKRRRMSYRGKKLKRSKLEVTRDIIEDYMEEIMKAGGIGCFVKGTEEKSEQPAAHDVNISADKHEKGSNDLYTTARHSSGLSKQHSNYYDKSSFGKPKKGRNGSPEDERRSKSRDKYDRERNSRFSDQCSSPNQSYKQMRSASGRENEASQTMHRVIREADSSICNFHDFRSPSSRRSRADSSERKSGHELRARDKRKNNTGDHHNLNSYEDRYNPSGYNDEMEDDYSGSSRYVHPDKL